jgi:dihydropteroate synthase
VRFVSDVFVAGRADGVAGVSKLLLVTGRLAGPSLHGVVERLNRAPRDSRLSLSVLELPISVAALMRPDWALRQIRKILDGPGDEKFSRDGQDRIVMPGRVSGDLRTMEDALGVPVARGPDDLWDIPEWLGLDGLADFSGESGETGMKIIAEITDAWRMSVGAITARAEQFRRDGADYIDLGGDPSLGVPDVGAKIKMLKSRGFLVSVDTFHRETMLMAREAGADMLLSVNSSNMDILDAPGAVNCPVVVVPDHDLDESQYISSLEANMGRAARAGAAAIADPILSPPLMGFVPSLRRFFDYRAAHPDVPMLMGAGNVTELLESDSAGVSALLAACLHELRIDYALTTEVAHWARGAVRELAAARGIMRAASCRRALPRRISPALRELKGKPPRYTAARLREMQASVTDGNWRIFVAEDAVCVFNSEFFLIGGDVAKIYAEMGISDPNHAFYIGRELQKAAIAMRLKRDYVQDDEIHWGVLP